MTEDVKMQITETDKKIVSDFSNGVKPEKIMVNHGLTMNQYYDRVRHLRRLTKSASNTHLTAIFIRNGIIK